MFTLAALTLVAASGRGGEIGEPNLPLDIPPVPEVPSIPIPPPILTIKRPDLIPVPVPGAGPRYGVRVHLWTVVSSPGGEEHWQRRGAGFGHPGADPSIARSLLAHRQRSHPPLAIGGTAVLLTPMPTFLNADRRF